MRRLGKRFGSIVCALSFSSSAAASPLFEAVGGFGGHDALQARHAGASAASTYFNPALLVDAPVGLTAGVLFVRQQIGVVLDARNPAVDVPDGVSNAAHADDARFEGYPLPTGLLQNGRAGMGDMSGLSARPRQGAGSGQATLTYEAVGMVVKMYKDRLGFGFYGLLPNRDFTRLTTRYVDEREQYFSNSLHSELYDDRLKALSLAFGGAARITPSFSLGLSATVALSADAPAKAFVADASRLQDLRLDIDARAKILLSPQLGLSWRPTKRWHLTGTLHAPQKNDVKAEFKFLLGSGLEQRSGVGFTFDYQPWQAGAGSSYDLYQRGDLVWSVTGSLLYGRWSRYIDRQATRTSGPYRWYDTLAGTLGSRLQLASFGVSLDLQYKPTPVPLQTGRTNFVDNDRLGAALVLEQRFELYGFPFKVGVQLVAYRLISRHQHKLPVPTSADGVNRTPQLVTDEVPDDAVLGRKPLPGRDGLQTNNPGWPGFASSGWIASGGIYLTLLL